MFIDPRAKGDVLVGTAVSLTIQREKVRVSTVTGRRLLTTLLEVLPESMEAYNVKLAIEAMEDWRI